MTQREKLMYEVIKSLSQEDIPLVFKGAICSRMGCRYPKMGR